MLVILLFAVSDGCSQNDSFIIPSSIDSLLNALDLPEPSQYSQVFQDFPAVRVASERSLAMLHSDCYE